MRYRFYSENEWVYPDDEIIENSVVLHAARGGSVSVQLLTDGCVSGNTPVPVSFSYGGKSKMTLYQLIPVVVDENSGAELYTTLDYPSVEHFVTKKAPFEVYDKTVLLGEKLSPGRAGFFIRFDVAPDAAPGVDNGVIAISFGGDVISAPVSIKIYDVDIPPLDECSFHMNNWLSYRNVDAQYPNITKYSDEYWQLIENHALNLLDMRSDYIAIPAGVPVRDENGKVVDFDFSVTEKMGNLFLKAGFNKIVGGFVAKFRNWDKPWHFLMWDKEVNVISFEAYRQLKIYFTKANELIVKNGWQNSYHQGILDETQFANSEHYRILTGICRKFMPGVIINDPVESTDLEGGIDIWVVKQAIYEKYIEKFRALQELGEEIWIYTCGFPAGDMMNRIIDLPVPAGRLPMWMCYKYNCPGFLHWGYNIHNPEVEQATCYKTGLGDKYPAGNSFIVYPGKDGPEYGIRAHCQRTGAEDYELLNILGKSDKNKALELIEKVCRTFSDYERDPAVFDGARAELLAACEKIKRENG